MYLITLEGGDGSGKGTAAKIVREIIEEEFTFTDVHLAAEPRRDHPLGELAVEAVRTGDAGPEREAAYFAADRLDHTHTVIVPRLARGEAVVCERNVHSSLVYQGVVGDLGVERIAAMNGAAARPDLTIWLDCDPNVALERISKGTLRSVSDKEEYFETSDLQKRVREGFVDLFDSGVPAPFDAGAVAGPILNHGSESELRSTLTDVVRRFLHQRSAPLNVDPELVESSLIHDLLRRSRGQRRLMGLGIDPNEEGDWMAGMAPWRVFKRAHQLYEPAWESMPAARRSEVPRTPLGRTVASIVGTLSLMPSADARELRTMLGPVRNVSSRHTQRILKFLHEQQGWIRRHRAMVGREANRAELRADWKSFGLLSLALWPLLERIDEHHRRNPSLAWRDVLSQLLDQRGRGLAGATDATCARLGLLGSGRKGEPAPADESELRRWFRGG